MSMLLFTLSEVENNPNFNCLSIVSNADLWDFCTKLLKLLTNKLILSVRTNDAKFQSVNETLVLILSMSPIGGSHIRLYTLVLIEPHYYFTHIIKFDQ